MAKIKKKVKTDHSEQRNSYFAITGNPFVDAGGFDKEEIS